MDAAATAMDAVRRLVRSVHAAHAVARGEHHVSAAQLFVLRVIAATPGQSLAEVATRTLTSESSASEVVSRLVQRGLVVRRTAVHDRRRAAFSVTTQGARVATNGADTVQERLIKAFRSLADADQRALARGLSAWLDAAGLAAVPATLFFEAGTLAPSRREAPRRTRTSRRRPTAASPDGEAPDPSR